MRNLSQPLSNVLERIHDAPTNGQTLPVESTDSTSSVSSGSSTPSVTTTLPEATALQNGSEHGERGVATPSSLKPATAQEAAELASNLVAASLPPPLTRWLNEWETAERVKGSVGWHPPKAPELTPELVQAVSSQVKSLSEILTPARERGHELELEVSKLFAVFNLFTGDEGKTRLQLASWADALEGYPLYAIRKAARWASRGEHKMPSLAAFITDVKLAVGQNVLPRKRLLEQWLRGEH